MTSLAHATRTDQSISDLLGSIIGSTAERLGHKVDGWTDDLNDIAHGEKTELGQLAGEGWTRSRTAAQPPLRPA